MPNDERIRNNVIRIDRLNEENIEQTRRSIRNRDYLTVSDRLRLECGFTIRDMELLGYRSSFADDVWRRINENEQPIVAVAGFTEDQETFTPEQREAFQERINRFYEHNTSPFTHGRQTLTPFTPEAIPEAIDEAIERTRGIHASPFTLDMAIYQGIMKLLYKRLILKPKEYETIKKTENKAEFKYILDRICEGDFDD